MDCVRCKSQNPNENQYCGKCGAILDGSINQIKTLLEATLRDEIHSAIADQFKDQKLASYEITETVVDRLLNWAKILGIVVGIPLTLVVGKGYYDLLSGIRQGKNDVATTVKDAKNDLGTEVGKGKKDLSTSIDVAKNEAEVAKAEVATAVRDAKSDLGADVSQGKEELDAAVGGATREAELAKNKAGSAVAQIEQTEKRIQSLDPRLVASEAIIDRVAALGKKIDDVAADQKVQNQLIFSALRGQLTLNRDFVNSVKDKATMAILFELDVHPKSPHSISSGGNDGDIHMSGRADEVGLPMVAEIMNARKESAALTLLKAMAQGAKVPVKGAWRIWFEHLGNEEQVQGNEVDVPDTSNPAHIFEIHPVTSFSGQSIVDSLVSIPGYQASPAKVAFPFYDHLTANVIASDHAFSIASEPAEYNYVEFVLEPAGQFKEGEDGDGIFVLANVYDVSDPQTPVTPSAHRMVFINDTEPVRRLKDLPRGQRMHVMGIPRVNLAEVAAVTGKVPIKMALPYEMIIVAVFEDEKAASNGVHP